MDDRSLRLWTTVGLCAGGLCLLLLVAFYLRSKRSFFSDFGQGGGILRTAEPSTAVDGQPSEDGMEAAPGEAAVEEG